MEYTMDTKRALRGQAPCWTTRELAEIQGVATPEQIVAWTAAGVIPKGWYVRHENGAVLYRGCALPLIEIGIELAAMIEREYDAHPEKRAQNWDTARQIFEKLVPEIPLLWVAQLAGMEPRVTIELGAPSVFSQDAPVLVKLHGFARAEQALRRRLEAQLA